MNKDDRETPVLVAIDWGTTNRRGYLIAESGDILDRREDGLGLANIEAGAFQAAVDAMVAPWTEARHPDHAAAGSLITKATFWAGIAGFVTEPATERFAVRQVLYYLMRHTFTPSLIVDTSDVIERKQQAIRCHASQVVRAPGSKPTLVNARDAVEAIVTRDGHYGAMIGARHGEPFKVLGPLAVSDPVAHFRANPLTGAFTFEVAR